MTALCAFHHWGLPLLDELLTTGTGAVPVKGARRR